MAAHEIRIDQSKTLSDEPGTGHNRWHPDIPPILTIEPGDEVLMETRDGGDQQISRDSTLDDLLQLDLNLVHPLTGPIYVMDAEPGDLLAVEILDVNPGDFGFTLAIPGFGYLRDVFTEPFLAKWEQDAGGAVCEEIPGRANPRRTVHGGDGGRPLARVAGANRGAGERPPRRRGDGAAALSRRRDHTQPPSSTARRCAPCRPASMAEISIPSR